MMKKTTSLLIILIALCVISVSAIQSSEESSPEILFSAFRPKTAPPALVLGEGLFERSMLGKKITLSGALSDTGAINLFRINRYDGFSVSQRTRLYVKERVLKRTGPDFWKPVFCQVEARVSKVDIKHQDHNEIEIVSYNEIDMKPVLNGLKKSTAWVEGRRSEIDLNRFKEVPARNPYIKEAIHGADINKKPFQRKSEVKAIDAGRGVAEYLCGRYVLTEAPHHHGYFLDILVIYDLKKKEIVRIVVDQTGYYLE